MSIPYDDRGLTLGDGLFETVLWNAGELVGFSDHAARLARSCSVLGLPAPDEERLREAARGALSEAGLVDARAAVRLSWTAGSGGRGLTRPPVLEPRLFVTASAAPRSLGPAHLLTSAVRRNEASAASRLKTLSYLDSVLARREAEAAGADEALMLNTRGEVACAAAANIFWFARGRLHTPAIEAGVLPGVARAEIIAGARAAGVEVLEVSSEPSTLLSAEGVFLTNALIGVRAVASLDGSDVGQQVEQATEWLRRGRR